MTTAIATQQAQYEGLQGKILNFLGAGIDAARVASAVGCDPSYISQLLADQDFADAVANKRLSSLQEATDRDGRLNSIEDKIISRTEQLVQSPIAFIKPMDAIRALVMVNGLKRRGAGEVLSNQVSTTIVNLSLPTVVTNKFTVDINNQVVKTGDQTLLTIASGSMQKLAEQAAPSLSEAMYQLMKEPESNSSNSSNSRKNDKVVYNELTVDDLR